MIAGLLLLQLGGAFPLAGQASPCDTTLLRSSTGPNGYKRRDDRCEGMVGNKVDGTSLFLVSFTQAFADYDLGTLDALQLGWAPADSGDLRIRAESFEHLNYYRMDTSQPVKKGTYLWPSAVLRAERITRSQLGVLGYSTIMGRDGSTITVYRAIRGQPPTERAGCGDYSFMFWPGVRLDSIAVSIARIDSSGTAVANLIERQFFGRAPYYAEVPITFSLPRTSIPRDGLHRLRVQSWLSDGGSDNPSYIVYLSDGCPQ